MPAVNAGVLPHHMANECYEPWQHQSWTNTDLEHNISAWHMCHDNDDHSVARTSAKPGTFSVAYGTLADANRRKSYGSFPKSSNSSSNQNSTHDGCKDAYRLAKEKSIRNGATPKRKIF